MKDTTWTAIQYERRCKVMSGYEVDDLRQVLALRNILAIGCPAGIPEQAKQEVWNNLVIARDSVLKFLSNQKEED